MAVKKCVLCEEEFETERGRGKYCSSIHSKKCKICGKEFCKNFIGLNPGQKVKWVKKRCCSKKCTIIDKTGDYDDWLKKTQQKSKLTSMKKYGVEWSFQSENNKEKSKQTKSQRYGEETYNNRFSAKTTSLERYGVENPAQSEQVKLKAKTTSLERYGVEHYTNREKAKQTMVKRYGSEYSLLCPHIIGKVEQTNLEKYGHENIFGSEIGKKKIRQSSLKKYGTTSPLQKHIKNYPEWQNLDQWAKNFKKENGRKPKYKDAQMYFGVDSTTMSNKTLNNKLDLFDVIEIKLELLVCSKLDELEIQYQRHNRLLIRPQEIDIYIPSLKLGIEINDLATHQPRGEDNPDDPRKGHAYHANKSVLAEKAGITLLHVWEDEVDEFLEDLPEIYVIL